MSSLKEITIENYGQHSSETQSSDQSLVASLNNGQNLDVESVIEQEQHKLVLSEATTDLVYPITACQKHPSKQPSYDKLYEMLGNTFFEQIEMMKHLHIGDTRRYQRTKSVYKEVKAKNRELETKITITEKELTRSEQELKLEKEKNDNLQSNLKIIEEKLKATQDSNIGFTIELTTTKKELKSTQDSTQDSNTNLQTKITTTKRELKESQTKIKTLTKKIKLLEKDIKILDKQRIKGEERKQ
ncbi:10445_t:CDS:2, partial [Cetraspora pellucida]